MAVRTTEPVVVFQTMRPNYRYIQRGQNLRCIHKPPARKDDDRPIGEIDQRRKGLSYPIRDRYRRWIVADRGKRAIQIKEKAMG